MPISNSIDTLTSLKAALASEEGATQQETAKVSSGTKARRGSKKEMKKESKEESKKAMSGAPGGELGSINHSPSKKSNKVKKTKALKIAELLKEQQELQSKKAPGKEKLSKETKSAKTT